MLYHQYKLKQHILSADRDLQGKYLGYYPKQRSRQPQC